MRNKIIIKKTKPKVQRIMYDSLMENNLEHYSLYAKRSWTVFFFFFSNLSTPRDNNNCHIKRDHAIVGVSAGILIG